MGQVLLVGGSGFIGQRVARALAAQGTGARVLDLGPALARNPPRAGVQAVAGDATDAATVAAAAQGCSGIVHLAGIMTVDCAADPVRAVQVNVMTSLNVLQAARAQGVPVAYLSTAGVFGPQDARHPRPMTVYGVTKLAVEGPPLRIPADLASDPVPADYGAHPVTRLEDGIAATLAELR